ncbi:MAG: hypothetical protein IMW95_03995 [Moorella humiferrea]|uniref:Uncharacterized protein n=1 Tax=Neomoorella humiferrea TaxID=676965 RepID=A0A2T0AQ76_9FIRM|nr:hypothetical protein [Moorella humiferrea]MBE3572092.1 hypothetical protein [Moorella humiferrea]PRR71197.1 hypothetical protein MOHU_17440 [Moorella humiferrea]
MVEEGGNVFGPKKSPQESNLGFNFPGGNVAFILFLILILLVFGDN